jgi:hypothetical protein
MTWKYNNLLNFPQRGFSEPINIYKKLQDIYWHEILTNYFIPNFKNFLSLHIFVQSLAEQKHAQKISEHTLIIMCNRKTDYNWYSKMPKPTYTALHPGSPREINLGA